MQHPPHIPGAFVLYHCGGTASSSGGTTTSTSLPSSSSCPASCSFPRCRCCRGSRAAEAEAEASASCTPRRGRLEAGSSALLVLWGVVSGPRYDVRLNERQAAPSPTAHHAHKRTPPSPPPPPSAAASAKPRANAAPAPSAPPPSPPPSTLVGCVKTSGSEENLVLPDFRRAFTRRSTSGCQPDISLVRLTYL